MISLGDIMLVNSNEMLRNAKLNNDVVYQFNINNLEWTRFILEKCNALGVPAILGVSEGAINYIGGYNVVVALVTSLMKDLDIMIPVVLHLDHGSSFESCKKAIDAGFTSVMIDASKYDLEENIVKTREVVEYAHKHNVSTEAEIGHVGGIEDSVSANVLLADYSECLRFVKETNIDSLAPAIGTVHGIYKGKLDIDYELISKLSHGVDVPIVMHGGSGLSDYVLRKCVNCGINKININSDIQAVWYEEVLKFIKENPSVYDPRKVISSGRSAIYQLIEDKINIMK